MVIMDLLGTLSIEIVQNTMIQLIPIDNKNCELANILCSCSIVNRKKHKFIKKTPTTHTDER